MKIPMSKDIQRYNFTVWVFKMIRFRVLSTVCSSHSITVDADEFACSDCRWRKIPLSSVTYRIIWHIRTWLDGSITKTVYVPLNGTPKSTRHEKCIHFTMPMNAFVHSAQNTIIWPYFNQHRDTCKQVYNITT